MREVKIVKTKMTREGHFRQYKQHVITTTVKATLATTISTVVATLTKVVI